MKTRLLTGLAIVTAAAAISDALSAAASAWLNRSWFE